MKTRINKHFWHRKIFYIIFILFFFPTITIADEIYKFERMWPTLQQPWYFSSPYGISIDQSDYIYIADMNNSRILKFTSSGEFVLTLVGSGVLDNQVTVPTGIAIDSNGHIYVMEVGSGHHRIKKFTSSGEFVLKWGDTGSEDGQFDFNWQNGFGGDIAIDPGDYVYVADPLNNRIQKFTSNGEFVLKWGSTGSGDGQFNYPNGIAVDASGHIYVTERDNNRIQKFTSTGEFISKIGSYGSGDGQFKWPNGINIDRNGDIYVTEQYNYRIQKFNANLEFLTKWGSSGLGNGEFHWPRGIAIDSSGYIYVTDREDDRIQKFTSSGAFVSKWGSTGLGDGEFHTPIGIAEDGIGNIYVADFYNQRVQIFSSVGDFIKILGEGDFSYPRGIATDGMGNVYVSDDGDRSIKKFTPDGTLLTSWGGYGSGDGQFDNPMGIAIDSDGYVYVADYNNARIQKFTSDGVFVIKWGTYGTGTGKLYHPWDIAIDSDGYVYVADSGNSRIQKFTPNGEFVLTWGSSGSGDGQFTGLGSIEIDSDDYIYVTEYNGNRIQKFSLDGQFIAKFAEYGFDPGQLNNPWWLLASSNGKIYVSDTGNNRLQIFKKVILEINNKAIVVAGGGPFAGNNLWDATQSAANFAYRTLTYQGLSKNAIYYLSSDTDLDLDGNGEPDDIDGDATNNNLQQAITAWAADASNLFVYLVDHGGNDTFRMSGTETLSALDLNSWLNQLQQTISGKVVVIYDACESGSFLSNLTPAAGKERIVVSSTSPGESAYFVSQGTVSFSNFFWTQIFNGLDIKDAFVLARNAIQYTTDYQNPLIDANGNGVGNETDDFTLAQNTYIGYGTIIQGDGPVIGSVSDPQTINGTTSANLSALNVTDDDGIARVWAIIRPPDYNQGASGNPVQNLPSIELMPAGGDRYDGIYDAFNMEGTYQVAIYSKDRIGNTSIPKLTTVSVNNPLKRKAIIVAGGDPSDALWPSTKNCSAFAYNALTFQGYTDNDIFFMSHDSLSSGVDDQPSLSNLSYAINTWAQSNTQDIVLYLVGNGGNASFRINETETLPPADLDAWLDDLQEVITGKVTVIYDADESGSFLPLLTPPAEKERILISSTDSDGPAYFPIDGNISFSAFFWRQVLNGATARDAFVHAINSVGYAFQGQEPKLDDSGNGVGNEQGVDGRLARYYTIGTGIMLAGDEPLIGSACPGQALSGEVSATVWVENVTSTSTIDKVWALIASPSYITGDSANHREDMLMLDLSPVGNGRYEVAYSNFTSFGTYKISIYAMDKNGNVSLPKEIQVEQQVVVPDMYEEDDTFGQANVVELIDSPPQKHTFHDEGDQDWVKFYGVEGEPYEIKISNVGINCDVVSSIYDTDGTTLLTQMNWGFEGEDELLTWTCPQNGIYYVMIKHFGSTVAGFGENAAYDLAVYRPIGVLQTLVRGIITDDNTGTPIGNALIVTTDKASAISFANESIGRYLMSHAPGSFSFTISAEDAGYPPKVYPNIQIEETSSLTLDFTLEPDSDGDGVIDDNDGCPGDINKLAPGDCGCGIIDTDSDSDGTADCIDVFPLDPTESLDTDEDGVGNNADEDDDNDGIADIIEAAGPNSGDANNDGTLDSLQKNVASIASYTTQSYVVIESPNGTTLSSCQATDNPSPSDAPDGINFDYGFFDFTIGGLTPGGSTSLTMTLPSGVVPITYYKYGQTQANQTDHWYEFLYDGETGAEINSNVITLNFVDALRGDDTLIQDNMVIDLGAPGFDTAAIDLQPTAAISSPDTDTSITAGDSVNFQGSVTSGNSPFTYSWNFGGGAADVNTKDPGSVTFSTIGTYTVTFTVTDVDNDTDIDTVTIIVNAAPDNGGDDGGGGGGGGGCFIETARPESISYPDFP